MFYALSWNLLLTAGLAVVLAALCRLPWMGRRPALAHWLWLLLLVKLVTPPLIPVPLLPAVDGGGETVTIAALSDRPTGHGESTLGELADVFTLPTVSTERSEVPVAEPPPVLLAIDDPVPVSNDQATSSQEPAVTPRKFRAATPFPYAGGLLAVSLIGTCLLLAVHAVRAVKFNRWLKRAAMEDSELADCCADVASSMGIRGELRSCVVDTRTTPLLWGWRRPVVAVPRQLVNELESEQLRSILAHELAHLVRRDHWANVFVCVVKALMWWNPVVWWADRELRVAQEMCCDAIAIDRCKAKRSTYAATLLKTLDFIQPPVASSRLALGMGSRGTILRRFEMIGERELSYRMSRWAILGVFVLGTALACMPVRGQEKKPTAKPVPAASEAGKAAIAEIVVAEAKVDRLFLTGIIWLADTGVSGRTPTAWVQDREKRTKTVIRKGTVLKVGVVRATVEAFEDKAVVLTVNGERREWRLGMSFAEVLKDEVGKAAEATKTESDEVQKSKVKPQRERLFGERPQGDCSISGKVVSAETGEPLDRAEVYLFYVGTHSAIFAGAASDGTFVVKDIPAGPYSLSTQDIPGYQRAIYNPEGKSGQHPQFSLEEGEHRSDVLLKPKPAYQISGKIRDAGDAIPEDVDDLIVSAWFEKGGRYQSENGSTVSKTDGSYTINGLDDRPVIVMVTNRRAEKEGNNRPPVFYPSTFSRNKAERISFDENRTVKDIDITLRTKGGLVLSGKVVDEDGTPIPEAFVLVHRRDMFGDNLTAYTDKRGQYRIQGLGDGEFLVHVDAAHRGYVRLRSPVDLDDATKKTTRDFTLNKGALISGKFVDREGNDWQIARSHGFAHVPHKANGGRTFTRVGLFNKYAPTGVAEHFGCPFKTGEGGYGSRNMIFPTKSTFAIHGMMPGQTRLQFLLQKEGQEVLEIRYQDRNILGSEFKTSPGDTIEDLVIVIGKKGAGKAAEVAETEVKPQRERPFGDRPQGNCAISGKVVSAETGKPVDHATVYLFYVGTHSGIFVNVASDGSFLLKDITTGPHSLQVTNTAGYQNESYDPEGKSGQFPQFSLEEGEHRADVVFKIEQACQISGKVLDENGKIPECIGELTVLAWLKKDDGKGFHTEHARLNRADGSYFIDRLGKKPAYVMAINWKANRKDSVYPPIYYPSTFNRDDARRITFDDGCKVENVDITLAKEGGLVLEGSVVDETGTPVPEAFVVVHRRDMLFDFVTAYTDDEGKYRMNGLGRGEFLVHVDAAHRGFVRIRTPFALDGANAKTRRDFTLAQGATISGKFVDEEGNDWRISRSHGYAANLGKPATLLGKYAANLGKPATILGKYAGILGKYARILGKGDDPGFGTFSLTGFRNKFGPKDVQDRASGSFATGEGAYRTRHMVFPTESTFLIQGMIPGHTQIGFAPLEEGQDVLKILHDGRDIKPDATDFTKGGIKTKAGEEVKEVTIVIGKK